MPILDPLECHMNPILEFMVEKGGGEGGGKGEGEGGGKGGGEGGG